MKVRKAVIPAAGLGTRMLPITKSMPKEMLPIVDRPVIHYVVEEAIQAGIDDILIITGKGKRAIEDYFDRSFELEYYLREKGKVEELREIEEIGEMVDIYYVRQKRPLGLGDAVLHAEKHVNGEPFAILLGDDIILSQKPAIAQLIDVAKKKNAPVIGVENVPWDLVSRYGIIEGERIENCLYRIKNLIEKPSPEEAPSNVAIIGRYILTPEIFDVLRETSPGKGGEIQLTDALKSLLQENEMFAKKINGRRYDVGSKAGFIIANIELSIARKDLRNHILQHMEKILREIRDG
ncbi:UTP--glucose-1-phosphate uridylyltransferase GalU [Thermococcus sp. GR7]|uniref:UTP--glucose-1-phosphate uridylyltransferase GalU n=1 Tax=unclassified Thermococcus TaxID=2627626 RepID=UPI00143171D6|nr:UTP--glucose-1-phosphate uridylyltransferase GalU [Thermococcus sp. GR7]NJE78281.1 UTP--glucose-1-phosphate uridylyltransferase GalU [Thermococcus sp. GR4]NJF22280.1 UTP--glucose-1-phosphate uridylyltransferase GalU [Thermococcus sp. GR5]